MELKEGYQTLSWEGQAIRLYKQKANESLAGIAMPYGEVADITAFNLPDDQIRCIVNCSYFNNHPNEATYGDYYGRFQGFESGTGEKVNNTTNRPETGDKPYMDLVVLANGIVEAGDFNSWDYTDAKVGVAPAGVEILHGERVNKYSPACGYGKITTPNTQTFLGKCSDGRFVLGVVAGNLAPMKSLQNFGMAYGFTELSIYDSGGSSQMLVNGEKKLYTGRKIPTCLAFVSGPDDTSVNDEPSVNDELENELIRLKAENAELKNKLQKIKELCEI